MTIDENFINKPVRLFIHQTMCQKEKVISSHNKVAKQLFNYFLKNTEVATEGTEAVTGGVL